MVPIDLMGNFQEGSYTSIREAAAWSAGASQQLESFLSKEQQKGVVAARRWAWVPRGQSVAVCTRVGGGFSLGPATRSHTPEASQEVD